MVLSLRRSVTVLALGVLTTFVVPMSAPAQAADNGTWAAGPSKQGKFTPRQYFFIEVAGGQTVKDSMTISNSSPDELSLDVFPSDAYNVPDGGGFALREKDQPNIDVGNWITVGVKRVLVPPATTDNKGKLVPGEVKVPVSVTVPKGATPGDHAGGIATLEPVPVIKAPDGSTNVAVRRLLGVRMYVRVAGPLTPSLVVEKVTLDALPARLPFIGRQGGATVTYTIKNSGNVRLSPARELTLKGLFGRTLHQSPDGATPEILPGSTVILSETFAGMPVLDWVTARAQLQAPDLGSKPAGDTSKWVISWVFVGLMVLLIGGIVAGVWWSRRDVGPAEPTESAEPEMSATGASSE